MARTDKTETANELTEEEKRRQYEITCVNLARLDDSPEAFGAAYYMFYGKVIPKHAFEEWVIPLYEARKHKKGIVIEAFRGSTKTTTLTIAWTAFRIGKEPHRANLLIQVGDDIANDNTSQVADIIANNIGFKQIFCDYDKESGEWKGIVPDRELGWGASGYEVKDSRMDYVEWRQKCAKRKDPTLVGLGYKSRAIIGKHPDGLLVVDDINDENNTSSERELAGVRKILTGTIFETITKTTWTIFVGTPWVENDILNYIANTGEFVHVKTPVLREDEEGNIKYTWPERFNEAEVEKQRKLAGSIQFARMFLLDLTAAQNKIFKYQNYPHSEIKYDWIMVGGCDYASHKDEYKNKEGKLDYFAICYLAKLPTGGAVVVDGVLDHCTQAQAEIYLNRAQDLFPNWRSTMVEDVGKSDDFIQVVTRNPNLRINPKPPGRLKKEKRLEQTLGPWLENGAIRISDAETPFLTELRNELDNYPLHSHDDAMDALYYAMRNMPEVLTLPIDEEIPIIGSRNNKLNNPYAHIGEW